MICCYRVITGACSFGTKDFVSNRLKKKKEYSVSEVIKLTEGEYGNKTFANFFNKLYGRFQKHKLPIQINRKRIERNRIDANRN
jgi:hypothetical protein